MQIEYALQVKAICPVDEKPDIYQCVVRTGRTVPVEEILEVVKSVTKTPLFQEDLTNELHRQLAAEVETVGTHSGVQTRVVCR